MTQEYHNHLRSMMEDRRVMMMAAAHYLTPSSVAQSPLLSIQIGAMDTASTETQETWQLLRSSNIYGALSYT